MSNIRTYNGKLANRKDCKKINGKFYVKGSQCVLMSDDKWYRVNSPSIVKDHSIGKYVFKNNMLLYGVVGINRYDEYTYGFFSIDKSINIETYHEDTYTHFLNRDLIINKRQAIDRISDGVVYLDTDLNNISLIKSLQYKTISKGYDGRLDYRCDSKLDVTTAAFEKHFTSSKFKHNFYKQLPDVTFGVEYESNNGRVSEDLMMQAGLIPVRDGSLHNKDGTTPYEYATIILKGEKGLQAISKQTDLLNKSCNLNHFNSLHVHIGGIPLSKKYVVSAYALIKSIQSEMYEMFPKSLSSTKMFKQRDYSNPIKPIGFKKDSVDENFDKIYKFLGMYDDLEFNNFYGKHPVDPDNDRKWEVKTRYRIVNFVPLLFGPNGTIEFRIHTSTFNKDKIVNWIYIVSAICQYAYGNKDSYRFTGITISDILTSVYNDSLLSKYLIAYVDYRKELMLQYETEGDSIGELDVENDNINKFNFKFKSLIEQWEE